MIEFKWLRKICITSALKADCRQKYGLRSRKWTTKSDRTPPYAGCYNIPKDWLEGEVGGHVVTFWGRWRLGFTGEVMVGAFDAWWNRTTGWQAGKVFHNAEKGGWEGRLDPLRKLETLLEGDPSIERIGISFKGLNLRFKEARADLLHRVLALAAETVDGLLARTDPPLLVAVKANDLDAAINHLKAGADPDEYGSELRSFSSKAYRTYFDRPLLAAVMNDDAAMTALLLVRGADIKTYPNMVLWVALENGKSRALKALFDGGLKPSPWELAFDEGFPLPFAAAKGDVEAVRILLEAGLDPGQKGLGFFNDAYAKAAGPYKDEIRRLLKEAEEREEQAEGRLALAPSADGAELSKAEEEKP